MKNKDSSSDTTASAQIPSDSDTDILSEPSGEHPLPKIPGYEVKRLLGTGGMARVFLAEDLNLKRLVALKMMSAELSTDEQFRQRFEAEGQIVASFRHPNIVTVYASGVADNMRYIAMEYVSGGTLSERLRRSSLDERAAIHIAQQIAEALSYSHRHGIIHRDLKPGNILFTSEDQPILSDFGIAKSTLATSSKTRTGQVIGSPRYMAPEQLMGKKATTSVDIYALGIVIYEMLTGRIPPQELSSLEDANDVNQLKETLDPEHQKYGDLIAECLSRDAKKRPTAESCVTRLTTFVDGDIATNATIAAKRQRIQWLGLGIVLLVALIVTQAFDWGRGGLTGRSTTELIPVEFAITPNTATVYVDGKRLEGPRLELAKGEHQVLVIDKSYFGRYSLLDPSLNEQFSLQLKPLTLPNFEEFSEFHSRFHQETQLKDVQNNNLTYYPFTTLLDLRVAFLQAKQSIINDKVKQLKALANVGDPASQLIIFLASDERLIDESYDQTLTWLREASIKGYALATYYYALHFRGKKEVDNMLDHESMKVFRDIMAMANRQGLAFAERFVQEADALLSKEDF